MFHAFQNLENRSIRGLGVFAFSLFKRYTSFRPVKLSNFYIVQYLKKHVVFLLFASLHIYTSHTKIAASQPLNLKTSRKASNLQRSSNGHFQPLSFRLPRAGSSTWPFSFRRRGRIRPADSRTSGPFVRCVWSAWKSRCGRLLGMAEPG